MALRGRLKADRNTGRTPLKKEVLKAHRLKTVGLDLEMETKVAQQKADEFLKAAVPQRPL